MLHIDYTSLNKRLSALIEGEENITGVLANATALLREITGWFWIGFYIVNDNELWLGPFQGSVACYRIGYGKGVCGTAWKEAQTVVVDDVHQFPGHIACSSLSKSEIVVPMIKEGKVIGVLDIDSDSLATFTVHDRLGLEEFVKILVEKGPF